MTRILILGINHQIQWVRLWSPDSGCSKRFECFEQEQKDHFRKLVRRLISERAIQFVGEETKHAEPAIAHEVSDGLNCRYCNIEMNPIERRARSIPANYENDPQVTQLQKDKFNAEREAHMYDTVIAQAKDARSILLICGRAHSQALASKFREASYQVEESDIQDERWYVEDWISRVI